MGSKMMRALIVILALSFASVALAQSMGGMSGVGHRLGRGGGSSGGGGGGVSSCTTTTTLDYSNSCNLIGLLTGD